MQSRIAGFHQDDEGHWVAELECGHPQHVRHDPPWQLRPWVGDPAGRQAHLGTRLDCPLCDRDAGDRPPGGPDPGAVGPEPPDPFTDARLQGLCEEGAAEAARRRGRPPER